MKFSFILLCIIIIIFIIVIILEKINWHCVQYQCKFFLAGNLS